MNRIQLLLLIASVLGGLLVAAHWQRGQEPGDDGDDGVVAAAAPRAARAASTAAPTAAAAASTASAGPADAPASGRTRINSKIGVVDAFGPVSWLPPARPAPPVVAAPPPPPQPPPAPAAPKLPFAFVGMVERGALAPQAYLAKGEALLIVSAGEVIDNNTYRVESLQPNAVVMTYLPLGIRQTLNAPGVTP